MSVLLTCFGLWSSHGLLGTASSSAAQVHSQTMTRECGL